MVINVGGLWERPTAIAEHRSDAPQVTLPSNICSESKYGDHHQTWTGLLSFRSSSSSCCNGTRESVRTNPSPEQFGAEQEDRDAIGKDGIIYNSESNGESWDRVEPSNLDSEEYAINGYSVSTENNFKANGISLKDGISASEQMFPGREAFNNFPADRPDGSWKRKGCTDSREGGDHAGGGRENVICIHASKALRVRSSGGKDRHSKVKTARGLRDRRVRLSVSTALQFYDIQDRLGYEQPSKALDWLLMKAKCAIDELPIPSGISNISCVSCKTISTISTSAIISAEVAASTSRSAGSSVSMRELSVQEAYTDSKDIAADFIISSSQQCSTMADARRSRDQARERARERAKQKVSGSKPRHSRHGVPTQSTQITFPYVPSSGSQGTNSYANYVSLPYPEDGSLLSHDQQISLLDGYIRAGLDPRFDSTSNTERLLHYSPHIAVPDTISPPSGRLEGANNSSNILSPSSAQLHSGDQALVMKKTRYISTPPPFNANVPYNHLGTADDDHDSGENFNSNLSEKCSTIPTFINVSASSSEDILGNVCNMDQSALMTGLLMNRGALQSMTSRPADVITSTPSTIYDEMQFMRNDIPWSPLQCNFSPRIRQRILEGFRFDREQYSNNITTPREQNP